MLSRRWFHNGKAVCHRRRDPADHATDVCTDVRATAHFLFVKAQKHVGRDTMYAAITGSGGMLRGVADLEFVQEGHRFQALLRR